jgi:hypothetical protein
VESTNGFDYRMYAKYFAPTSGTPTVARGWVEGGTVKDDALLRQFTYQKESEVLQTIILVDELTRTTVSDLEASNQIENDPEASVGRLEKVVALGPYRGLGWSAAEPCIQK